MRFFIERTVEGNLYDPILWRALGSIKEQGFLVQMKKSLLDNIFGLAAVPNHTAGNSEYQACVAMKEGLQGARITRLHALRRATFQPRARGDLPGLDAHPASAGMPTADQPAGRHLQLRHAGNRPAAALLRRGEIPASSRDRS